MNRNIIRRGIPNREVPGGRLARSLATEAFCGLQARASASNMALAHSLPMASNSRFGRMACTLFLLCAATVIDLHAETFSTLLKFRGSNGNGPYGALVQGTDGNFYGITNAGGSASNCPKLFRYGCGTVFKITPAGTLTTLYNFCSLTNCTDGSDPSAGLMQATDGDFYGTTLSGGSNCQGDGCGTVFKITASGTLTTLHIFDGTDGYEPGWLIQASDGALYGTTQTGGDSGAGTIFRITPTGKFTSLYTFCAHGDPCLDGVEPFGRLIQAPDGYLYGTSFGGGPGNYGTVFRISPGGMLTTLHSFDDTDGSGPTGLMQTISGDFYGTTQAGGANNDGTVFKMTPAGTLTTLHSFCSQANCADGSYPFAGLVEGIDGNLYGTTGDGGASSNCPPYGCGTIFKMTPAGSLTTVHNFDGTAGANSQSGLLEDTNGIFYGSTQSGGINNYGIVFSFSMGLGSFVKTQPHFGVVGAAITILGTGLTGATSVTFNGMAAEFTVDSTGTAISTTVPAGSNTGKVEVVTPSGTLLGNGPFVVLP